MTTQEAEALAVKNIKALVPELAGKDIDVSVSYTNLGISSLDLVEVVNKTMRDMDVKVAITELAKLKTIKELAQALTQAKG